MEVAGGGESAKRGGRDKGGVLRPCSKGPLWPLAGFALLQGERKLSDLNRGVR